jgi:4-amino-4-deoxy-L-arabinose transferase-like glycosyltransferase
VKPLWYYFVQLPLWFLPSTFVLIASARRIFESRGRPGERFLLSWALTGFLFLCVAGTKRAVYVAPLLPPLSILAGERLASWNLGRRLEVSVAAVTLALAIAWGVAVPGWNDRLSCKPFCRDLAAIVRPGTRLAAFDVDETALAVVPFYTGRRLDIVASPSQVSELDDVAVLTQDVRGKAWHSAAVAERFPHLWLSMPEGRDHRMRLFSNRERP